MKLKSIVEDCQFNKGVVVSKCGFTNDALTYAKSVNIGLVILREPIEEDWKGRIKIIVIQVHILTPEITKFEHFVSKVFQDVQNKVLKANEYVYSFQDGKKNT